HCGGRCTSHQLRTEMITPMHHCTIRHPPGFRLLPYTTLFRSRRDRMRLHSRGRPRHALRLEPGGLHAELLLLPHRHAEAGPKPRSEEHTSELQSREKLVCRLLQEKTKPACSAQTVPAAASALA